MKKYLPFFFGTLVLLAGMLIALRIGGGSIPITWKDILDWMLGRPMNDMHRDVIQTVRLPRILMAALAGAVLSCSGGIYQALLRNPLADPYTLGVAGGATLGAVLALALSETLGRNVYLQSVPVVALAALAGGALTMLLIDLIARRITEGSFLTSSTLILAGVTINMVFASLILLIQYFADYTQVYAMIRWMMGGLDVVGYRDFVLLAPLGILGFALAFRHARDLDLIAVDPVTAASLGVRVEVVRRRLLMSASLMTAAVVALAGPIGFVGLIVPHAARMALGASHRRVIPACLLAGALFLIACDTLAQNILRISGGSAELPVGVITSMLGGPFFLYLLLRRNRAAAPWS
jgi:iron complex transport system permease protein